MKMAENLAVGVPFDGDSHQITGQGPLNFTTIFYWGHLILTTFLKGNAENGAGSSIQFTVLESVPRKQKQKPAPEPNANTNPDNLDESSESSDSSGDDNELDQSEIPDSTSEIPSADLDTKM